MSKTQVLLTDRNGLFRDGLGRILSSRGMKIAIETATIADGLNALRVSDPIVDLMICDPAGDTEEEFSALRDILAEFPAVRVVLLTEQAARRWQDLALNSNVSGVISKDISTEALRLSLELALLGEKLSPTFHSRAQKSDVVVPFKRQGSRDDNAGRLSPRENQILNCLVDGLANKVIASKLEMAEATVKVHIKALFRKINVHNRTQAAIWGLANLPPSPDLALSLNPAMTPRYRAGAHEARPN